jgi:predicted dehydrogenase
VKQVFITGKGGVVVLDVPAPGRLRESVLVRNAFSVISAGTEGASVTSRQGLLGLYEKVRSRRDLVEKVWNMFQSQGAAKTWEKVWEKVGDYSVTGYGSAGIVVEVSDETLPYREGSRVACMGAGLANHAEYVAIPKHLVAPVPNEVSLEQAAFGALGCIALQGIRRLDLTSGERVGVLGLGLVGQICVRILSGLGYETYGFDIFDEKASKAAEVANVTAWSTRSVDSVERVMELTNGVGLDGVVVCAATADSAPVNLAFDLCRKRGRISVVGDVGLNLNREKMYEKETELRLSCSYGPGRYDPGYELGGRDYPIEFARWTEHRNLTFFLRLLSTKRVDLEPLVSLKFSLEEAESAYGAVKAGHPGTYGVLFDYGVGQGDHGALSKAPSRKTVVASAPTRMVEGRIRLGLIGVGGHAKETHLPNIRKLADLVELRGVAGRSGASAGAAAARYGIPVAASDYAELLAESDIDAVIISTRHASHAAIAIASLEAGKHVFVEKPLCLTVEDAERIGALVDRTGLVLRVDHNRRFSPHLKGLRSAVGTYGLRSLQMRVNTGRLPGDWSSAPEEGGRILGEAVHFFDLANWFMGCAPLSLVASAVGEASSKDPTILAVIDYEDGSSASLLYTSLGNPKMGKEYYEAFGNGRAARSDDFKSFSAFGASCSVGRRAAGDKGHKATLEEFVAAVCGRSGGEGADWRAGLLAVKMALACISSAKSGNRVSLQ